MPIKQNEPTIIIDHVAIPLTAISGTLRRAYENAVDDVSSTPAGPAQNLAKSRMNSAATACLREAAGNLALKISPRSNGAAGYFEAYNKRA